MHPRIAICSFVLLWIASTARADTKADYAEVQCDPVAGTVTITPHSIWDGDWPAPHEWVKWSGPLTSDDTRTARTFRLLPQADYGECHFADGTRVRIRMGIDEWLPYGFGGGSPPYWVSAWVDGRKWVSRQEIGGMSGGNDIDASVVITSKSVTICSDRGTKAESCRSTPASALQTAVDTIEYPRSGDRVRAGTLRVRALDAALCDSMIDKHENGFGTAFWGIKPPASAQTAFPAASDDGPRWRVPEDTTYTEERFDANNDGIEDVVLSIHPMTHPHDGDIYFRLIPERFAQPGDVVHTIDDLIHSAAFVYPFGWARCCDGAVYDEASDTVYLDAPLPFATPYEGRDRPWRAQYLHLTPFVDRGSTYFLISTRDSWAEDFQFVVKPHPDDTYDVMCRFERIAPNF